MTNKEIIINNLRTEYLIKGNIKEGMVVFLPGWMAKAKLYKKAVDKIENVVILDWPGFGNSQQPIEVWSIEEYAVFLKSF